MKLQRPLWVRRVLSGVIAADTQRFDAALGGTQTELDRRSASGESPHIEALQPEIDDAEKYRAEFKLDAAWSALKGVERGMARYFDASELVATARVVRSEADDKLSNWRRTAVADLLPDELLDRVGLVSGGLTVERHARTWDRSISPSEPIDEPTRASRDEGSAERTQAPDHASPLVDDLRTRLIKAKRVVDDHTANVYHKFRILRRAVIGTSVAFGLVIVALFVIVALDIVPEAVLTENSPLGSWRLLLVVICLGAIGAFLSSATELRNRTEKVRIPDIRVNYTLMAMRPVVGAAGAIVVIVILQSALGDAVTLESTAILGIAIASGFTERLVTRTVTSAANALG